MTRVNGINKQYTTTQMSAGREGDHTRDAHTGQREKTSTDEWSSYLYKEEIKMETEVTRKEEDSSMNKIAENTGRALPPLTEKSTLRELKDRVKKENTQQIAPQTIHRVSGKVKVSVKVSSRSSVDIAASYRSEDYSMTVFENGYVVAVSGKRWTVFKLDDCGGYEYPEGAVKGFIAPDERKLSAEFFDDLPWTVRVMMEADDRLEKNNDKRFKKMLSKHPGSVDMAWLAGWSPAAEDEVMVKERIMKILSGEEG